ncbi:hypothetical protein GQX74_003732 [Glossina fuscipes]|nr:hypothetical protein GQX74_003732 [Glossina fuscipes]
MSCFGGKYLSTTLVVTIGVCFIMGDFVMTAIGLYVVVIAATVCTVGCTLISVIVFCGGGKGLIVMMDSFAIKGTVVPTEICANVGMVGAANGNGRLDILLLPNLVYYIHIWAQMAVEYRDWQLLVLRARTSLKLIEKMAGVFEFHIAESLASFCNLIAQIVGYHI